MQNKDKNNMPQRKAPLKALMLGSAATLVLAACTMAPDYQRPALNIAKDWPVMSKQEATQEPIAPLSTQAKEAAYNLHWSAYFDNPALQKMIAIAIQHNKDLALAALNIQEARAQLRLSRADLFPSVNAEGSGTLTESSDEVSVSGRGVTSESYEAALASTAYELDLFGKIRSQNEAAVNEYLATAAARDAVQNTLIAEVANTYLQYLADKKLLSLTEKTLEAQQQSYNLLKRSFEEGVSTETDLSRAETAVETARVNLYQYRRRVEQDKNALFLLLGVPQDEAILPDVTLDFIDMDDTLSQDMPSEVLITRPDVKQAEYTLMARNADIGAARAAFFPSISLTGSYGFASDTLGDLFAGSAFGAWSFIPQITMPIFQAGRNQANLDVAEIRKDKAIISYEKAIQQAFREVADELAACATLSQQLAAQRKLVAAAQRVYDTANERYKNGIDSFLSVLDAQRELYTYEQNEIETQRLYLANIVNLYKVLGGGSAPDSYIKGDQETKITEITE